MASLACYVIQLRLRSCITASSVSNFLRHGQGLEGTTLNSPNQELRGCGRTRESNFTSETLGKRKGREPPSSLEDVEDYVPSSSLGLKRGTSSIRALHLRSANARVSAVEPPSANQVQELHRLDPRLFFGLSMSSK